MKKSEKILGIVTGSAILIWIALEMGIGSVLSGGEGGSAVDLARKEYDTTVAKVASAPEVYEEFYRLVGTESEVERENQEGYDPDSAFQRDVSRWATSVGFTRPRYDIKVQDIRDRDNKIVDDYQLVVMSISLPDGDLPRFAQLMKLFEENGLIIQNVELRASSNNDRLSADITIARLVKFFKQTPARLNRR